MSFDPADPIGSVFADVVGQSCWNVRPGYGSAFMMEFGAPHLEVREPTESRSKSEKVRKLHARRRVWIKGDGSFSIDQQRYNAQFGGQVFYEIKGGKITGVLKDVAYQIRTPDFWNAMDMIGGKSSYQLGGSFFDGKGQPGQVNAVSHGAVPARFKQINVINTGRKA